MEYVVFLDTNSVNSTSFSSLFGNSSDLLRLSKCATLVVPSVVLDELIEHKRRHFVSKSTELKKNPLLSEAGLSGSTLDDLRFEDIEFRVRSDKTIPYTLWELPQPQFFFDQLLSLVIRNEPPFDAGSDKGFKDACVAFTVLDYIEKKAGEICFVLVTSDCRLEEYFSNNPQVRVVKNVIDALAECGRGGIAPDASPSAAETRPTSAAGNPARTIAVDSNLIEALCDSPSFQATHEAVQELLPFRDQLTAGESVRILRSAAVNQQINWILTDDDVASFMRPLFDKYSDELTNEQYGSFVDGAGLPNHRVDEFGNPIFSRSEQYAYQRFAEGLMAHLRSVECPATFEVNPGHLLDGLKRLLSVTTVDNRAATWADAARLLINGPFSVSDAPIGRDILKCFAVLLEGSSPRKREAIVRALATRLESVAVDYPF